VASAGVAEAVTNEAIVAALEEIALLLEYLGDNPFRCRAYRAAAETVSGLGEEIASARRSGRDPLAGLPGIGTDLADKIGTLADAGRLPLLDELRSRVPPVAVALVRVPGLGPKKARLIVEALGVGSLEETARACREGRVAALKGFGDKTQAALLRSLSFALDPDTKRMLWRDAEALAARVCSWLEHCPDVVRTAAVGSIRRGRETVGNVDLLASGEAPAAILDRFLSWPEVTTLVERGAATAHVHGPRDVEIRLTVVTDDAFAAALITRTGSAEHVGELSERARQRGFELATDGIHAVGTDTLRRCPAAPDEAGIYALCGVPWIPPELREGPGTVARAESFGIPRLVTVGDIRGDLHMHTTASDGEATLVEMARGAIARRLEYIAITDHGPRVAMARGLGPERLLAQWEEIDALNASLRDADPSATVILKGVEVDMLEQGGLDLPDDVLARADWVVASLHYGQQQSCDRITARIIEAIENPWVSVIGHPTGRLINRRPAYDVDIGAVIAAAARTGTFLEINANPWRLDLDDRHAAAARDAGVGLVVSTDAHAVSGLDNLRYGILQARRAGCVAGDVVNTLSLTDLRARMRRP